VEFLTVARVLLTHRVTLVVGLVASVALGMVVGLPRHATAPTKADAFVRVLVDTHLPLAVATTPTTSLGVNTIVQRTDILSVLMGGSDVSAAIAARAGVPSTQLSVLAPQLAPVSVYTYLPDGELPQLAATAAKESAGLAPFAVQLATDAGAPIISIGATAPTRRQAVALAQATVATMQATSTPSKSTDSTLTVKPLGPIQSAVVKATNHAHRLLAAAVAVGGALAWCALMIVGVGLGRWWRRVAVAA
jgi:hypothetical protein